MIRIEASGFADIQRKYLTVAGQPQAIVTPYLANIANHLAESVREELRGGGLDPYGFVWHGNLLSSVQTHNVAPNEIDIVQSDMGNYILYGTKGNSSAKPSPDLVDWCMDKISPDKSEAYGAAIGILRKGILSDRRGKWGGSGAGFGYADYIVTSKEDWYLSLAGQNMANLLVKYLDTGM